MKTEIKTEYTLHLSSGGASLPRCRFTLNKEP